MKCALWIAALLLVFSQQRPVMAQGSGDNLVKQAVAAEQMAIAAEQQQARLRVEAENRERMSQAAYLIILNVAAS